MKEGCNKGTGESGTANEFPIPRTQTASDYVGSDRTDLGCAKHANFDFAILLTFGFGLA
jgi:hypothetical protein